MRKLTKSKITGEVSNFKTFFFIIKNFIIIFFL